MRRCTGILSLGLSLLTMVSVQAQQVYTQSLNFQASNQSMWSADLGTAGFEYTFPLIQSWSTGGPTGSSSYRDLSFKILGIRFGMGKFGAGATVDTAGEAGLIFNAIATSGSVDVQGTNQVIRLTAPDSATLAPGQTFTLSSAYTPGSLFLTTHSPDAGVSVKAVVKANPAKINLNIKAFSRNIINNDIFNTPVNLEATLFNTRALTSGDFTLVENLLTGRYHVPVVTTSGSSAGKSSVLSSGSDYFLSFKADFSNVLARLVGIPPLSNRVSADYQKKFGPVKIKFQADTDYSFLDLYGSMPVLLAQNFSFTPHPMITLNLSTGQTVTFEAGQSVQLTMPSDGSPLTIVPTVAFNNQFKNTTSLKLGGGIQFTPAEITTKFKISKASLGTFHFKPLRSYNLVGGVIKEVPVFDTTFNLGGFTPQTLPPFTLTPPTPPTLVAQNDTFTAVNQGDYYTLHIDAPGVLANDTGAAGFTAVPQSLQLDGNAANFNRFVLNSDGSLDYVRVAGAGSEDFSYQIVDSLGRTATATIHIVRP